MLKNFLTNLKYKLFNKFVLKVKLLGNTIETRLLPKYMKDGDACMDVRASEEVVIKPKQTVVIPLGFAVELSKGYELQVRNRSGLAKAGLIIPNGIGTIDSGYRGEVHMMLYNTTNKSYTVKKYDRVGQIVVNKVPFMTVQQIHKLSKTERGTNGFGSTGVN